MGLFGWIKKDNTKNMNKTHKSTWKEYVRKYYYDTYGSLNDQEIIADLQNQLNIQGYFIDYLELMDYITSLKFEVIKRDPEDDSWKKRIRKFHDTYEFQYSAELYASLLNQLIGQGYSTNYHELVNYIAGLGKSDAVKRKEIINEEKLRQEREKIMEEKKTLTRFYKSPDFNLIVKFVNKFGYEYSNNDLLLLQKIINMRGYKLGESIVEEIVKEENKCQIYHRFVKKVTYNNPNNLEGFLENFCNFSSFENEEDVETFLKFLYEIGLEIDKEDIERQYELLQIKNFEESLSNMNDPKKLSIEDIDKMSGSQFEQFLAELLNKQGYDVTITPPSYDQGADLIIKGFGETIAIQAKCYANQNIGNSAVQEIVAAIKFYHADRGIVVTNSNFSQSATNLARSNKITLINRNDLSKWLESDFSSMHN
jgi:hypothetical protein